MGGQVGGGGGDGRAARSRDRVHAGHKAVDRVRVNDEATGAPRVRYLEIGSPRASNRENEVVGSEVLDTLDRARSRPWRVTLGDARAGADDVLCHGALGCDALLV